MIKMIPKSELPREKAIRIGFDALSDAELLAILLRTGNKQESVMEVSQHLLYQIGGIQNLQSISYQDLTTIKGIKMVKAITLLTSIELAKRLVRNQNDKDVITSPESVYQLVKAKFLFEKQEKVMVLCLNSELEVVKEKVVFVGSNDMSIISGKEIMKEAIISSCSRIIIIHNHPSGNPNPSNDDIETTEKIRRMARELDIELLDHIIVGENCFYSFTSNTIIRCIDD